MCIFSISPDPDYRLAALFSPAQDRLPFVHLRPAPKVHCLRNVSCDILLPLLASWQSLPSTTRCRASQSSLAVPEITNSDVKLTKSVIKSYLWKCLKNICWI